MDGLLGLDGSGLEFRFFPDLVETMLMAFSLSLNRNTRDMKVISLMKSQIIESK